MPEYRLQAVREYTLTVEAESESAARQCFIDDVCDSVTVESDAVVSVVEVDSVPVRERPWWDVLPGDYNELTRERDGYRADAEAERRRSDLWGY
jgi:hypothetical protein